VSGLVRIGFCDDTTGDSVGYGLVRYQDVVDCEGVITSSMVREYFDLTDVTQGATLPVGWVVCEEAAAAAGGGVALNDLDGTALVAGNTVSRGVVDFDGVAYPTDGNGRQVIELSHSRVAATGLAGDMNVSLAVTGTSFTSPASAVAVINNPSNGRPMNGMWFDTFIAHLTPLNAGGAVTVFAERNINGGGWVPLGAGFREGPNSGNVRKGLHANTFGHLVVVIPAGGSVTMQRRTRIDVDTGSVGSFWSSYSGASFAHAVTE
jgi:hypothetical protein